MNIYSLILCLDFFFEPFLFEQLPAVDIDAQNVYLSEVERSDVYLGILSKNYGFEDTEGVSLTEREFNKASENHFCCLIFIHTVVVSC
ncbi:MAG: hypothetical protein B6I18_06660 [Bacteroidetes bacterium 4572_112]|nr:MAG: hypothetical protein B6I18_06660 [Bacteroidetes bacterium 4572_112]